MGFFDEFKHIVPYYVKVNVGKNKEYKTDYSKRNNLNFKGKMFAIYRTARNAKELETNGIGRQIKFLSAEEVSIPIDIKVISDERIISILEETSKFTNRRNTKHNIRVFNVDRAQVGYISLTLTPSGDIQEKTSIYDSPDESEQIIHKLYNKMYDKKLIKDELFSFKKSVRNITKQIDIAQREGNVLGCTVIEKDRESKKDNKIQSMIELSKIRRPLNIRKYISLCVENESENEKYGETLIPWECKVFEKDLLKYKKVNDEFQEYIKLFKEKTGKELSIEKVIELGSLSDSEIEKQGYKCNGFNFYYCLNMARYLNDNNNDLLKDFKGDYVGNILKLTEEGYESCVVTKYNKDGQDYRLYTLIDFRGTSLTQGTGMDEYLDIDRDEDYFNRLKTANKNPTFVTKVNKNDEELVLYRGKPISGECKEYKSFLKEYILPFVEIKPIQMKRLFDKINQKAK